MALTIRAATAEDETAWRRLWAGYCGFYGVSIPEATTGTVWRRILDPSQPTHALVACDGDGAVLGFANHVLHQNTWGPQPVCYLEDLYTDPAVRGRGVGRGLILRLVELARSEGWSRVYWHTRSDNATARALYDRVAGPADGFVRYVLRVE